MERIAARTGWALALILIFAILSFHNVLVSGFHYDDEHSIVENPHLRSLSNVPQFFIDPGTFSGMPEARMYRPLLLVTYALNYAIDGYEPLGWHLVNLLLHLANAGLVWWVAPAFGVSRYTALIAGLIFAVHPVLSESVNYVSCRSSLLATFFLLLAFKALGSARGLRQKRWWLLVCVAYCSALMAKSIAIVFPLLVAIFMVFRGRVQRGLLGFLFGFSMLYVLATRAIIGRALLDPVRSIADQWATQIKAGAFYIWKVAVPVGLSVEPQFAVSTDFLSLSVLLPLALLSSLAGLVLKSRRGDLAVFGMCWFAVALLPSALVPLHVLVNEHRLYLPMVGLALGGASLLNRGRFRPVLALGLLVFAALSIQRNEVWRNEETLWRDAVAKGPQMARPHVNLGKALLEEGDWIAAIESSQRALAIDSQLDRAHYNIGTAYLHQSQFELASAHFNRALEIRPELMPALNNLGNTLQEQGLWREALAAYLRGLAIQQHASIYHNMGNTFLEAGYSDSARICFRQALSAEPGMREAYKGLVKAARADDLLDSAIEVLGVALVRWPQDRLFLQMKGDALAALGREEEAMAVYRRSGRGEAEIRQALGVEALKRSKWEEAYVHFNLALAEAETARALNGSGTALLGLGRVQDALDAFRRAGRLDPEKATAFANIGRTYLKYGRFVEAIAALERASALEPESGQIQALLAQALERTGALAEAIAAYQKAIALEPENGEYYHNLGFLYYRQDNELEAEKQYRNSLERNPRQVEPYFNLGSLYLDQGHYERAVRAYKESLILNPEYSDAWINIASAYLKLGRNDKVVESYQRALGLDLDPALRQRVERQLEALETVGGG